MRGGEPIWLETAEQLSAAFPELPRYAPHAARMHALVALPLKLGERVLGAVSFGFDEPRAFQPEERELILAAAQQCAQALERARLFDAERRARERGARPRRARRDLRQRARRDRAHRPRAALRAGEPGARRDRRGDGGGHVGRTPRELLPRLPHEEVEASFHEVLGTGRPKLEVAISGETPAAPGRLRHWRASWYPVRVEDEIIGLGVLVREVTDERKAEEFQRNVLGIVGHDLRNPLSAITTSAQLLLRQATGDAAATRLGERILWNADRMQRIIAVLVDYARVRAGPIPLRPRRCELGAVCRRWPRSARRRTRAEW